MKNSLRKLILAKRSAMSPLERKNKSDEIRKRLFGLQEFKEAKAVMFFVSYNSEVQTHKMISEALKEKIAVVPKTSAKNIVPSVIKSLKELSPNKKGILEPRKVKKISLNKVDVVIVPGAVFDKRGNRIGYGQGYYDRFLKKVPNALKIGLAFDLQVVKKLPNEKHDIPVDVVLTERRILRNY